MLSNTSVQLVLDGVCAALCVGRTWSEVRGRSPLKATSPLYAFVVHGPASIASDSEAEAEAQGSLAGGFFDESRACLALTENLDAQWQRYGEFTKARKRQDRLWVEKALAAQPGFLEGGLALASMQHDAAEPEAAATLDRFIKQAEALIPDGFKGRIPWGHLGNRFYHRMLWLRLQMHHDAGNLKNAVRLARKQLKLNSSDNLGVRFVLPLLLLQHGDYVAAKRAATSLRDDHGPTACAIRSFCEFAVGDLAAFRCELACALISLPWLRVFLMNQRGSLPDGDDGFRGVQPEMELSAEFAWPAYVQVAGLVRACRSFLQEPRVLALEADLWRYWSGFWVRGGDRVGSIEGWRSMCAQALSAFAEQ